jgi:hypothetical protein
MVKKAVFSIEPSGFGTLDLTLLPAEVFIDAQAAHIVLKEEIAKAAEEQRAEDCEIVRGQSE